MPPPATITRFGTGRRRGLCLGGRSRARAGGQARARGRRQLQHVPPRHRRSLTVATTPFTCSITTSRSTPATGYTASRRWPSAPLAAPRAWPCPRPKCTRRSDCEIVAAAAGHLAAPPHAARRAEDDGPDRVARRLARGVADEADLQPMPGARPAVVAEQRAAPRRGRWPRRRRRRRCRGRRWPRRALARGTARSRSRPTPATSTNRPFRFRKSSGRCR